MADKRITQLNDKGAENLPDKIYLLASDEYGKSFRFELNDAISNESSKLNFVSDADATKIIANILNPIKQN